MENKKRFTWARLLAALGLLAAFSFFAAVFYLTGQYYGYRDDLSGDIVRGDQLAARDDLERLKYFYELNKKFRFLGLNRIADKHLFEDALRYEAAYDYLTNRHERVIEEKLKNDDSFWGRYLRANSKWRLAQGIFEKSLKTDTETRAQMQKDADEMAYSTKDDYEEAVKISQGKHLPSSWNYDLTTDASARAAGLQPKPGRQPKIKLGAGGQKNKGQGKKKGKGEKGEGSRDLEIQGPPTEGKPKPGTHRPG